MHACVCAYRYDGGVRDDSFAAASAELRQMWVVFPEARFQSQTRDSLFDARETSDTRCCEHVRKFSRGMWLFLAFRIACGLIYRFFFFFFLI